MATGSKVRRPLTGFSEFKRPSRALASGSPNTGGNPSGHIFEDTNGNAWYAYYDVVGCLRVVPAATIEPNPQTTVPSFDFLTAAGAFTATPFVKTVGSIADATATPLMTVTVPNAAAGAVIFAVVTGAIGAGGAVGAYEVVASQILTISVARVAGVNCVANQATVAVTSNAAVSGATTVTLANALSSITGAVGASNSFTLNVTITKGGGASGNHNATVMAWLFNPTAAGVSLS